MSSYDVLLVLPAIALLFTLAQRNLIEESGRPARRPLSDRSCPATAVQR